MTQMFTREALRELYRHMEWADATVWRSAPMAAGPDDERLKQLFVHVHVVQRAFLCIWVGRPVTEVFRSPSDFTSLTEVREWARSYYADATQFVESVDPDALASVVRLPWSEMLTQQLGHPPGPSTLGETAFQVTSHSTYHRGQINARLRELGVEPPLVDYIAWLWFGRPEAAW